jgi:hypothetical protein
MGLGARDGHPAGLERLSQRLQGGTIEFRNYVADAPNR